MRIQNALLAAATAGILAGSASTMLVGCGGPAAGAPGATVPATPGVGAKHACKGQNDCKAQGGCKTEKHACKGQNDCKGQGGCKTT